MNDKTDNPNEEQENKYSYLITAVLRLVVFYGGIYFIYQYVDSEASQPSKYSHTDSLGGEGAGVVFIMLILSIIWTIIWYIAMIILMAREKDKKSSIRAYSNLAVLLFPPLTFVGLIVYVWRFF